MPKYTFKDIINIVKSWKKKDNVELTLKDLNLKFDSYVRVRIYTEGFFFFLFQTPTPILGKGILIKVELFFTYLNRGFKMDIVNPEDNVIEDLYLLIRFTIEKSKNKIKAESLLAKPLEWCLSKIKDKETEEALKMNHPSIFLKEDIETQRRKEALDKIEELRKYFKIEDPRITKEVRKKVDLNRKKAFVGLTVDEKYDKKTGKSIFAKKKIKSKGFASVLNDNNEIEDFTETEI